MDESIVIEERGEKHVDKYEKHPPFPLTMAWDLRI
jgi:hypothetical protein